MDALVMVWGRNGCYYGLGMDARGWGQSRSGGYYDALVMGKGRRGRYCASGIDALGMGWGRSGRFLLFGHRCSGNGMGSKNATILCCSHYESHVR